MPIPKLKALLNNNIRKSIVLYGAMITGIVLGFGVSIVNTRYLSVEDYGKFKFIQQLFTLLTTVSAFGFAYSAGRLVTRGGEKVIQCIVGVTFIIYCTLSLLTACLLFSFSFFINDIFSTHIASELRLVFPFIFVSIFTVVLGNILQGTSSIYSLAAFRVMPRLLYVLTAFGVVFMSKNNFTLHTALLLNYGIAAVIIWWLIFSLKPRFDDFSTHWVALWQENKKNGFHVYLGSLANVATANLLGLTLAYFVDMKAVGYYSLALIVSAPLQFVPAVIGTTLFKSFSSQSRIQPSAIWSAVLPTLFLLVVFLLVTKPIVIFAYSSKYLPTVSFSYILAFGMIFHGMGDFFNRFLGAHGKGKELRNAAVATGIVLTAGSFISLPLFGVAGAVWIKTISSCVYFLVIYFYYHKVTKTLVL